MIEVKPVTNKNIEVNQIKIPKHLERLVEFVVVYTVKSVIRSKQEIDINIHSVSENEIQELNKQYRSKDKVTNVLSFPCDALDPDIDAPRELGDIFVCLPYVEREAEELGVQTINHFVHMLVHGCLHLLGYDHERDQDFQKMKTKEISLLNKLGVPNPYLV